MPTNPSAALAHRRRKRTSANWAAVFFLTVSGLLLRSPLLHASAHAAPPRPRNTTSLGASAEAARDAPAAVNNATALSASPTSSVAVTTPTWWNPPPAVAAAAGHERRAASPSPAPVAPANSTTVLAESAARSGATASSTPAPPPPPPRPVPYNVTRPVPQFYSDPACLRPIVNWDFYMSQVSHLFRNVVQRTRRKDAIDGGAADDEKPIVFEDLFAPSVTGHVNVLGNIQGIEASKRYFQTLQTVLLTSLNMSIVGLSQTHATAACEVASMIHHVSLRDFGDPSLSPPDAAPAVANEPSEATPNLQPTTPTSPRTSNNMRRLVRRVLQRAADAVDPASPANPSRPQSNSAAAPNDSQYPQIPSASSPSSHAHPSWLPHVLAIWSWWRFDTQTGKIVAFEITAFPRDGDHWAPPRGDMVDRVCSEFDEGGRCSGEKSRGEWAGKEQCVKGMRQMDEVNTARVTCRYLHLPLLSPAPDTSSDHAAACRELGPLSSVCVPPNAYWFQPPSSSTSARSDDQPESDGSGRDRRSPDPAAGGGRGGDNHHGKAMILDQGVQRKQGVAVQDVRHVGQEGRIEYYEWPGHVHVEL